MPELRYEQVTRTWVIIATERAKRPSDFAKTAPPRKGGDNCPFCPGHESMTPPEVLADRQEGTAPDTPGWTVRVVPNKFSALDRLAAYRPLHRGFFNSFEGAGAHEVIIETPDHDRPLALQDREQVVRALNIWRERYRALGEDHRLEYTQIFKNHGAVAGASLEHPHTQLIATPIIPIRVQTKLAYASSYYEENGSCYYCDSIVAEEQEQKRIIYSDDHFVAFCPFASRFPLEVGLIPRQHQHSFAAANPEQLDSLARALSMIAKRLMEGLNDAPFNLLLHTSPYFGDAYRKSFHWHLKIHPRLTLIAGFELGTGMYINPTPPEMAGEFYRAK